MGSVGVILITAGIILVLGAAGASDQGLIPFGQTIIRVIIGFTMVGAGTVIIRIANELKRIKSKKGRKS